MTEKICICGHGYSWHNNLGDCTHIDENDGGCGCSEFEFEVKKNEK